MAVPYTPKPVFDDAPSPSSSSTPVLGPFSPFTNAYNRFSAWRANLGLSNPGSVENLQRETRSTHVANVFFDGARADLTKILSINPTFQVTHSFALASPTVPSSYNLATVFANQNVFLQGSVDNEGNVGGRFHQGWSPNNVTKAQLQLGSQPGHNMLQLEHDCQGSDFSLNVKAINPSPVDGSGMYLGSYLQSLTKNIALGAEMLYQRASPDMTDISLSYLAKLTGTEKNWIATAQVQPIGVLQATYWQKLSEKVDAAADLQLIAAPARRDAIATVGAKYDLRMSTFRAQFDSTGKVAAVLEQKFAPTFTFTVAGEIDHFKNAAKIGVGVLIESSSLTPEEMDMMAGPPPQ
ncbi:eukaryotic porin-domain-containing protein [Amylostereum chailletii]|nr:eukaryotic porin-domain-containing protein [Amylostereum chailletii]